jgi:hypothetical protein
MYAHDQVVIHTARITAYQINQCHDQSTLLQEHIVFLHKY